MPRGGTTAGLPAASKHGRPTACHVCSRRREGAQVCAEGHVSAPKGGKGGHGWARMLPGSQSELRNGIPVPGFPGRGSLTLLQAKLFLALLSLPQTSSEYVRMIQHRGVGSCAARGDAQRHRPTPWPRSLLSLAWSGWFAGGPAPDREPPEQGRAVIHVWTHRGQSQAVGRRIRGNIPGEKT